MTCASWPSCYCRSPYTNSALPAAIATYWRPPTAYDIGPADTWPPTFPFHSVDGIVRTWVTIRGFRAIRG